jgi:hypothetical protein
MTNAKILIRRDLAANWVAANPVLCDGEQGYEKDTGKMKIGDGITPWNALLYFAGGGGGGNGATGPTGPTGPQGPVTAYAFDGGFPNTNYVFGPIFDLGGVN